MDDGNFRYVASSGISRIEMGSHFANSGYTNYIDAVGYSWDTTSHSNYGYNVGWNTNPDDLEPLILQGFNPILSIRAQSQ